MLGLNTPLGLSAKATIFSPHVHACAVGRANMKNDAETGLLSEITIVALNRRVFKMKNLTKKKYDYWLPLFLIPRVRRLVTLDLRLAERARPTLWQGSVPTSRDERQILWRSQTGRVY